jgi:sec-independent protein translocase protein TatC
MYLLKKVIQLREKSNPDHEKPFLEHLEDLRIMVTRIVMTLLVSVIVCFTFQKQMMEVLRLPVEEVWMQQQKGKLPTKKDEAPRPLTVEQWEEAKSLAHGALGLDAATSELYFANQPDAELVFHARCVSLLRAAKALPEGSRKKFIDALDVTDETRKQVLVLLEKSPSAELDSRGNLRLMSALKPTETFMLSMKISFFSGIVVAFPLLLYFILQFVLPGLHKHERKVMWPALAIGFGLFLLGVLFAYFIVLPKALNFFYEWSGNLGVSNDWRIGEYITFATQFTLLFGLSFELPVLVMVMVKLGLLTYETMSNTRAYAVLAIVVIAALITPTPDAFTLMLMAGPMIFLYEICIWLAWFDRRKNRMQEEKEAREDEERRALAYERGEDDVDPYEGGESQDTYDWAEEHSESDMESTYESGDQGDHSELEGVDFDVEPELPEDRGPAESVSDDPDTEEDDKPENPPSAP